MPDESNVEIGHMNTMNEKKKSGIFFSAVFLVMAVSMVCLGCSSSADNNYYTSGQTSRSFTDSAFDYEQLKIEKTFHVVNEEYPSCSLMIDFLSENKMMIRGKEYRYRIEVGRIVILDPDDHESMMSYLEVVSDNADSSDYIAVDHMFPSRQAAEKSGLWIGALPSSMPFAFKAKWYRTSATVGGSPTDMVMAGTATGDYLYVANSAGNSVSVIQTPENKVVGTIPVNIDPYRLAVSQDGSHVYVTNSWDNTVSVIRTSDNTVVKTIRVGRVPNGIAVSADGAYVLVANTNDASISIIETTNHTLVGTIPMGPKALSYIEVFFSVPPDGRQYAVLAVENDCGALVKEPDMSSPICQANPVSGECPTKCPSSMGRIEMAFSSVVPNAEGFWRSEFLNSKFKTRTYTLLLVENFAGQEGFDLDRDDNGIFDYQEVSGMEPPWDRIVDEVGVLDPVSQGGLYTNVMLPIVFREGISEYVPGGYSRIPNGEDTDSEDDWVANNVFSCWLSPMYDDSGIIHLSDIPQPGRAFHSPGESNVWNGETVSEPSLSDHPVINEFMINRLGYTPLGLTAPKTLSPNEESCFYVSTEENTLLKIRLSDYTIVEKIPVGDGRIDMALLPDGDLYIANSLRNSVAIVRNGMVLKNINIGFGMMDIASSSDGRYVFITNSTADNVAVIRTSDQTIIDIMSLGKDTVGITTPMQGNFFYITHEDINRVSVFTYTDGLGCE
ncbi:MAG: beta-propeller fold lactonase family protein [Pseudomonadota bacterium]